MAIRASVFFLFLFTGIAPLSFAMARDMAGTVARLTGTASATTGDESRSLQEGAPVYAGDRLTTDDNGRLLVRFEDGSNLTLGGGSDVKVDAWVFNQNQPSTAQQTIAISKGVFRFVSGQVASLAQDKVAITTPTATIGIRGTEFVGGELTVGMPAGQFHYGFQIRKGAIEVQAPGGTVLLDDPGEGTFLPIGRTAAPTPVRKWTPEEAAEVDAALQF